MCISAYTFNCFLYADDLEIDTSMYQRLQALISNCAVDIIKYISYWKLKFDKTQTEFIKHLLPTLKHSFQSCYSSYIFSVSYFDIAILSVIQIRILEVSFTISLPSAPKSTVTS